MIKAIIFDVDDTLIDSGKAMAKTYIKVARNLDIRIPEELEVAKLNGLPGPKMVETLWPNLDHKVFKQEYSKVRASRYDVFPSVKEVIDSLKKKSYLLGILTSRKLLTLEERFSQAGIDIKNFEFLTTTSNSSYHKPDPRVFDSLKAHLRKNGISGQEALYVGDSMYDFEAATRAGLSFVCVLQGAWTKEEFLQAGLRSASILKSLRDLPIVLEAMDGENLS